MPAEDSNRARWLSLRITADIEEAITAFAEEDHRSKSAEIAWILEQYVRERRGSKQDRER